MDLRKVYGGTSVGMQSRCDTCVYARIIRGYSESEKITICDRIFEPIHIPFPVRECSDYLDRRLPCVEDLEDIAWILRSSKAGKTTGFVSVVSLGEAERAETEEDEQPQETPAATSDKE